MNQNIEILKCSEHGNAYNDRHPCPLCVDVTEGVYEQKLAAAKAASAKPPLSKPCLNCENDFYKKKTCAQYLWDLRKFCSPSCAGLYRSRHTKTE